MNVIVCIKQVPASSNVKIDPVTGVLIRDGLDSKLNPYDLYAIECALQITSATGGLVTAITMGPPAAKTALKEAISMGCNKGVLITDRLFAGADVLATSYTISSGIKQINDIDLIICGKQTTDGDTAQVGPEIAEMLHIPHVSFVNKIISVLQDSITVEYALDHTTETVRIPFSCLITVDKDIYTPRLPSYKRMLAHMNDEIIVLTLQDFTDKDESHYGLKGSPTQVEAMFSPTKNENKVILNGSISELSEKLFFQLKELKVI